MNEALPGWLGTLREDGGLSGDLGIRWLDEDERLDLHAGAMSVLEGMGGDAGWNERGLARFTRCVPLALGPERKKRMMQSASSTALFFDPDRPAHVSLSMAASMSPLVWAEAPATAEGIRALFERYFVAEAKPVAELSRRFRTVANFGDIDREHLEEALTSGHPMLDDATWYSSYADDPWRGMEDAWGIVLMARLREVRREHGGRFPSVSFRTLFSRSVVKIEQHPFGLWVVELRYAPSPDAAAVRWVNEVFRSHFPEDVPADVIGSNVMQGGHTFAHDIDEQDARGPIDTFGMAVRLALAPGEPESSARLRAWIERARGDEKTLGFLANAAASYHDHGALFEITATAEGTPIAESILARMAPAEVGGGEEENEHEHEHEHEDADEDEDEDEDEDA